MSPPHDSWILLTFGIHAILCGCGTGISTQWVSTASDYVAQPRTEQSVEIFTTSPDNPHRQVGLFEVRDRGYSKNNLKNLSRILRKQGAKHGCDAVLITGLDTAVLPAEMTRREYSAACIVWTSDPLPPPAEKAESPPVLASEPARDANPPTGAAGFDLGMTLDNARTKCLTAGFKWSDVGTDSYRCDGQPVKTGLGEDVILRFSQSSLCTIDLRVVPSSDDAPTWMGQYKATKKLLVRKYGRPTEEKGVPNGCHTEWFSCVKDGSGTLETAWDWTAGRVIRLTMGVDKQNKILSIQLLYGDELTKRVAEPNAEGL